MILSSIISEEEDFLCLQSIQINVTVMKLICWCNVRQMFFFTIPISWETSAVASAFFSYTSVWSLAQTRWGDESISHRRRAELPARTRWGSHDLAVRLHYQRIEGILRADNETMNQGFESAAS